MNREEYILCAANYYDDGIKHDHKPTNINTGFIICGHRHHNCISLFAMVVGFPYTNEGHKLQTTEIQGFLTNTNKFVNREEAALIAYHANQVSDQLNRLHSEDLY